MADFAMARLEEIEEVDGSRCPFRPVRHHLGIRTFGVNSMTAHADGDRLINEHDEGEEDSSEELYIVISGHATFEIGGETREAPAGTFVLVPPATTRTAFGRDAGTTVIAVGAAPPGQAYEPNGWEMFAPLFDLFESGDYEEGADRSAALLVDDPPYGAVYYNTACFESRVGRTTLALTHLRRAIELTPSLARLAHQDADLAPLRDSPEFTEITGGG